MITQLDLIKLIFQHFRKANTLHLLMWVDRLRKAKLVSHYQKLYKNTYPSVVDYIDLIGLSSLVGLPQLFMTYKAKPLNYLRAMDVLLTTHMTLPLNYLRAMVCKSFACTQNQLVVTSCISIRRVSTTHATLQTSNTILQSQFHTKQEKDNNT